MAISDLPHLARRATAAASSSITTPNLEAAWWCSTSCISIQAHAGQRYGRALELQGGQVRIVLGRNQRQAAADVHDAPESRWI